MPYYSNSLIFFLATCVLVAACTGRDGFSQQQIVSVLEEPRHRVVHRDGDLYLLDVQIPPGDISLPHTHDSAMLYTIIHDEDGPADGVTASETEWAERPFTHEVVNQGPGLLHVIALSNYGLGISKQGGVSGSLANPQLEDPWFRSFRIKLEPGEATTWLAQPNPLVVVQVTEGLAMVMRKNGKATQLAMAGHWAWSEAESFFRIRNAGSQAVELVINEGRVSP